MEDKCDFTVSELSVLTQRVLILSDNWIWFLQGGQHNEGKEKDCSTCSWVVKGIASDVSGLIVKSLTQKGVCGEDRQSSVVVSEPW